MSDASYLKGSKQLLYIESPASMPWKAQMEATL